MSGYDGILSSQMSWFVVLLIGTTAPGQGPGGAESTERSRAIPPWTHQVVGLAEA
jgi:hypothetical protein